MAESNAPTLLAQLEGTPDPRSRRGRSFEWRVLLAIISAALVSGYTTPRSIAHWALEHAQALVAQLQPAKRRLPSASTLYRVLRKVNRQQLETQVAAHNQAVDADDGVTGGVRAVNGALLRGQAVDGKAVRGANTHGHALHLVSLVRHESGCVLGQCAVAAKSNEITAVPRLLAGRDLRGTVTTMDALLTQQALARQILAQQGHYLMVVKENQPELDAHIALLFNVPPVPAQPGEVLTHTYTARNHGRLETRTLEASTALTDYLDWPGTAQVMRRTCQRVMLHTGVVERKTTYGITSLGRDLAEAEQLEAFWRGHWTIENQDHYVRDETLGEDRGQTHTGSAPQALAALRNAVISLLRYRGWTNIAATLRHYGASVHRALQLVGWPAT
ncbi:MAG: ISAs1 family transposase [Chloroflexi bacterium]|nr:ISAs1 family transposase [Chloroflexota bacterium]